METTFSLYSFITGICSGIFAPIIVNYFITLRVKRLTFKNNFELIYDFHKLLTKNYSVNNFKVYTSFKNSLALINEEILKNHHTEINTFVLKYTVRFNSLEAHINDTPFLDLAVTNFIELMDYEILALKRKLEDDGIIHSFE